MPKFVILVLMLVMQAKYQCVLHAQCDQGGCPEAVDELSKSSETQACSISSTASRAAKNSLLLWDRLGKLDEWFEETRAEGGRWFLAEYDFDNRGYNVLHFQGHSPLPLGFSLWGFIDLEGADNTSSDREDISRHFLELDVKRKLWRNTGVIAELNDLQGQDNEIGRFGCFWFPDLADFGPEEGLFAGKFRLGFKFFPVQTVARTGQWSFNWNKQFDEVWDGRVSAGGFFDLNYNTGNNSTAIVTEHQIRLRVAEGMHLITEFRLNEYLADEFGIAPGIQYRF
ncbi:MAG: hypothetical protein ACE361_15660 [Aureliella sp.]